MPGLHAYPSGEPQDRSSDFRQSGRVGDHRPGPAARGDLDTDLTSVAVAQPGHDGSMEPVRGETSPGRRGIHGALANKRAADSRALALVSIIRELMASGFVSRRALAEELNRRGIPTAHGGKWHYTTVTRMLTRLGRIAPGKGGIENGLANRQAAANARAKALAPRIRALHVKGLVSPKAIARALNEQEIPTARSRKWHPTSVGRLLHRLETLELSSGRRRHKQ